MFSISPSTIVSGSHVGGSPVAGQVWWCWVSDYMVHVKHRPLSGPLANKTPGQSPRTSFFLEMLTTPNVPGVFVVH